MLRRFWFLYVSFAGDGCASSLVPLPDDWVKINYEVKVNSDSMCVVVLAIDHKESVLWVASNILNFSDPLIGEVVACLLGFESTILWKHLFVIIESDFETVINTMKETTFIWDIGN
uniref:RNase H type-1 domain-containing protein n=1 Tax=Cannabis sativa TaxID=3483 RepID=A0A803PB38_CANSA